jgi:hypothetical protein
MLNTLPKRFILPFAPSKNREFFGYEVELASVYAVAELERGKGGGMIVRKPEEKLSFIAQIGYPLWLFPNSDIALIFDGANPAQYLMSYPDFPTSKAFIESLENCSKTKEEYLTFLSDHQSYFQQPTREKQLLLKGLIPDENFKKEFTLYRKEATETSNLGNLALLNPTLEESTISSMLSELSKLRLFFKEDADKLPECLRLLSKTTSQFATELEYAAQAVKDEANAKIRAREELVNPQIAKLNSDYKHKIADMSRNYDDEIQSLTKQKEKTEKSIESNEEKIKQYQHQAQSQAKKNHANYEKRWKEKGNKTKKELDGLKKEQKRLEKQIRYLTNQKNIEISKLSCKFDEDVKSARQPILDLEALRDVKMAEFKEEILALQNAERPVAEGLYRAIRQLESINSKFEDLGFRELLLKSPALFYVPFFLICYQAGLSKRYFFVPPSSSNSIGFSAKLKGVFRMAKVKDAFSPRFPAIAELIQNCQTFAKQNTEFDIELNEIGEKNNLLNSRAVLETIAKGLVYLSHEGWLSDNEYQALNGSLEHA